MSMNKTFYKFHYSITYQPSEHFQENQLLCPPKLLSVATRFDGLGHSAKSSDDKSKYFSELVSRHSFKNKSCIKFSAEDPLHNDV
ncbi:hypothetical protein Bhyg_01716 [Pseudolycoriella hygida]|uniref:Uncharacterized protein n=1 Tax=Pseudolycoriella hygida TaxID=35572 RepID=A0A9Q0NBX2_9DIPT|nr:hypothetical protein Bhyg_01716 [Pseudolycoriella hygida]